MVVDHSLRNWEKNILEMISQGVPAIVELFFDKNSTLKEVNIISFVCPLEMLGKVLYELVHHEICDTIDKKKRFFLSV